MRRLFACLAVLVFAGVAHARNERMYFEDRGTVLDDAALNGAAAALTTSTMRTWGFSSLLLAVTVTDADDSVTAVTFTCAGSGNEQSNASSFYDVLAVTATGATGIVTYKKFTGSFDTGTAETVGFTISVIGHRYVKCIFDATGAPAAADKITVKAIVGVP